MIYLIIDFMLTSDSFSIVPATTFQIIIPRLLSSIMMHMNVEPDIRNGIQIMKWVVNHPEKLKLTVDEEMRGVKVSQRRVFFAFLMGFAQTVIAIVVEFCVIIYLSSLTNLIDIIMKFVSMAAIARFDDMYASALFENPMKKAAG
mmetsp:Transcript_17384/g.26777  ORF Transcript_17384/g.26777 Transcript_17384/m.26777 type:complete len:145 (+) Transcript_17384:601-1035(+)